MRSKIELAAILGFALALTLSCSGGNDTYRTVVIGNQIWMAKNLNYDVPGNDTDVCYGNDPANCTKYGRLYNWPTAMALPSNCTSVSCIDQIEAKHRGICPSGWHIPDDEEWDALINTVGSSSTAGTKLKSVSGWNDDGNGTDVYGFAALPGGEGDDDGSFSNIGERGFWWSASENGSGYAYSRDINHGNESVYWSDDVKHDLFSVRCLQD